MRYIVGLVFLMAVYFPLSAEWELIWTDEFEYSGFPDKEKWDYDVGTGSSGWGNNELQYYTREAQKNAKVENGVLTITADKERVEQCDYTSARLVTRNKGDWLYGRFEISAKLPVGRGLWPAIWMLPTDWVYKEWPKSGEIDIMENVGFDPYTIHFNIHTEAYNHTIKTNKGDTLKLIDPHTDFNVYALEWYKDSIVFYAGNRRAFTFKNEYTGYKTWPFDQKFHLLLNIAVGGNWGGMEGIDTTIFPASMIIDYVRVYALAKTKITSNRNSMASKCWQAFSCKAGVLTLQMPNILSIQIYNPAGILVKRYPNSATFTKGVQLNLPNGIYYVCFNGNTSSFREIIHISK